MSTATKNPGAGSALLHAAKPASAVSHRALATRSSIARGAASRGLGGSWQSVALATLLAAAPLTAAAAGDPTAPAGPTAAKPGAANPAVGNTSAAAKPSTSTPAAKPAASPTAPAAKPAETNSPAAKPGATAAAPGSSANSPAAKPAATTGAPGSSASSPAAKPTATTGAPGFSTNSPAAKPGAPAPTGGVTASAPSAVPADPASAHLTLAQATAGLKGTGAIVATIEIAAPGKPVQALHCELYADKAPLTVANFLGLGRGLRLWKDPKSGQWAKRPLYDGNLLHRVVPELLIQGGDPSCTGDPSCRGAAGIGDPGYTIADEIRPELRFDRAGRLAMSNRGASTGGSQFFITEREASWLTGSHTIFGQCDGTELVAQLSHVEAGSRDMPKAPLLIKRISFARKGG